MSLKDIIIQIKKNVVELGRTPAKDLIEASTGKKVILFDEKDKNHILLLNDIKLLASFIVNKYYKTPITREIISSWKGKKINAFRNNEVGDYCEFLITDQFNENKSQFNIINKVVRLVMKGYPDIKIELTNGNIVFLEIKATSRPDKGSARDFYYTPGKNSDIKIDHDSIHLLLGFVTKEIKKDFILTGFKIVDVAKIKLKLKPEFNTDNLGIYCDETVLYKE